MSKELKMYSMAQVVTATFLGSPMAGGILISQNYKELGESEKSKKSIIWAAIGTLILIVLALVMPQNIPNSAFLIIQMAIVGTWYSKTQESYFKAHKEEGGIQGSWWKVVGIGLGYLIGVFVAIFAIVMALPESMFNY